VSVIHRVPQLLSGEQARLALQLGDFGIWPGPDGRRYLDAVSAVLDLVKAQLWFADGNHEDFGQLARMAGLGAGWNKPELTPASPEIITIAAIR
jgi:hypothetical protein